jgi:hypothetical protein
LIIRSGQALTTTSAIALPVLSPSWRSAAAASTVTTLTTFRLQQGFATGEMGFGVCLHGSNGKPLMSALGQKQTLADVRVTSALPPKADIGTQPWNVRFVPKADEVRRSKERHIRCFADDC